MLSEKPACTNIGGVQCCYLLLSREFFFSKCNPICDLWCKKTSLAVVLLLVLPQGLELGKIARKVSQSEPSPSKSGSKVKRLRNQPDLMTPRLFTGELNLPTHRKACACLSIMMVMLGVRRCLSGVKDWWLVCLKIDFILPAIETYVPCDLAVNT